MKSGINIKQIKVNLARLKMRSLVALAHGSDVFQLHGVRGFLDFSNLFARFFLKQLLPSLLQYEYRGEHHLLSINCMKCRLES